ncbi:TIGR00303 family protein [Geitlerinema splendidum]|nr:TIGR00303 family protein [Geitlerinema splendidum]
MIRVYTQQQLGQQWLERYRGTRPNFACILGFTDTGLIPGISAAGATPEARRYTCLADAEFLYSGPQASPEYPLPPLVAGASPVLISRAVIAALNIPLYLFNSGLPIAPPVPCIDLQGMPARCMTTACALDLKTVKHLFDQGYNWGEKLAAPDRYLMIGECVVGGTTTALGVLTGLGIPASGKVNSSHPSCNHAQKWQVVQMALSLAGFWPPRGQSVCPFELVAAVGDPMQITAAGMAIAASQKGGVLLAGGTQMLAVYALIQKIAAALDLRWYPERLAIGTTRWVAEDPTGDTVGLARILAPASLIATQLSFASSRYAPLQAYERGYVKEGVGAGGCAIAASLLTNGSNLQLIEWIEALGQQI